MRLYLALLFILLSCTKNKYDFSAETKLISFQGKEDSKLPFEFKDSTGLSVSLEIVKEPKHGVLSECNSPEPNTISCLYTPNENFYGVDHVELKKYYIDTEMTQFQTINLEIKAVGDKPIAKDVIIQADANKKRTFYAPLVEDLDSLQDDVEYRMIEGPKHGLVNDECFLGLNKKSKRECTYSPDKNFVGSDTIKYQIVDETNETSEIAIIKINVDNSRNIAGEK